VLRGRQVQRPWSRPGAWRNRSRVVRAIRLLRTRSPVTFNDKVRYKLLRDHRELMVTFADKASMRSYVADVVGERYLPSASGPFSDATDLVAASLPELFVLKPTHGSGACIVVDTDAPPGARLPAVNDSWCYTRVHPDYADRQRLALIGQHWLGQLYGRGPNHEWAYGRVPRRLLVEELLRGPNGGIPEDYKLFVFHGRCHYIQVDGGRFGDRTQDFFDRDWRYLAMSGGHPASPLPPGRPELFTEMIRIAEELGTETDFVRVDLFCLPDRVVVGELTSSPAGGDSPFYPPQWNATFGLPWTVPARYR
jgi:hypothetical protein